MEKLDVEYLQKLTYDRSKSWASFFDNYENDLTRYEDLKNDIDITKIDQIYCNDEDDGLSDDLASMEEDCDDSVKPEFLKNVSNTSQFSLFMGNTTVDLTAVAKTEEEKEYVDVINKTLPVINEHNRKLHQFGFDKVLISFNKAEIEDKFGTWLNRHNSLFGGDNSLLCDDKFNNFGKPKNLVANHRPTKTKARFISREEMDDSDCSLQSGETARYIRSSRVGSSRNTTSTIIKRYRMEKSRAELREKYAFETDEDGCYRYDMRGCKKLGNMGYENQYITPLCRLSKTERVEFTTKTRRRKVLRKRINSNGSRMDNSSSDSESSENYRKCERKCAKFCCNKRHRYAAKFFATPLTAVNRSGRVFKTCSIAKMSSAYKNRLYYYQGRMSLSSSSTPSSSFSSVDEKRRNIKRKKDNFSNDKFPYKRESECHCYNDKELCNKFKHIADTSTEEWHVDSGCSPQKQIKNSITKPQIKKTTRTMLGDSAVPQKPPTERRRANANNKTNSKENTFKLKNEEQPESIVIDSSDSDLKLAIEKSKKTYIEEQKKRQETPAQNDNKFRSKKSQKKPMQNEKKPEEMNQNANSFTKKSNVTYDLSSSTKRSIEETLFIATEDKAICNSTALSTQCQAYRRQLTGKQQKIVDEDVGDGSDTGTSKDITVINVKQRSKPKPKSTKKTHTSARISKENVTSTTLRSPELNLLPSIDENKQPENTDDKSGDEPSDCTHVTSTTTIEVPTATAANKETDKTQPQLNLTDAHDELTRNCVLIYAPDNENMPPADGYFTVSQDHLSALIGEKAAKKFLKYYVGRKRFRLDSAVYYKPPNVSHLRASLSSSSESADDLDSLGQYGDLFAITK